MSPHEKDLNELVGELKRELDDTREVLAEEIAAIGKERIIARRADVLTLVAERDRLKRSGKELGKIVNTLADLIKDAYLRGADDPIDALHMLGNHLAELLESDGGLSGDERSRVYRALEDQRVERDTLKARTENAEAAIERLSLEAIGARINQREAEAELAEARGES